MSRWYMDSGEYADVDRDAGIAYDNDNDAWVELGSTDGSTPVWWRMHGIDRNGSENHHQPTDPKYKRHSECINRCRKLREELERLEEESKGPREKYQGRFGVALYGAGLSVLLFFGTFGLSNGSFNAFGSVSVYYYGVLAAIFFVCATIAAIAKSKADEIDRSLELKRDQYRIAEKQRRESARAL